MLTVLTEIFGVKGEFGSIRFEPQLLPSQFDSEGKAGVEFEFNGKPVNLTYRKSGEGREVKSITVDGVLVSEGTKILPEEKIGQQIEVVIG